jgi:hypothetical protein
MNKRLSICFQTFVIGALFFSQSFAITSLPVVLYPQYRLTPTSPTTQDSVSFWLVKGTYSTSCVPQYSTSFKIEHVAIPCLVGPCPPFNEIILSYSQSLVLPLQAAGFCDPAPCPNVIVCMNTTTEYGPSFNFGKLPAGDYSIIDTTDNNRTVQFTVASPKPATVSGNVIEDMGTSKVLIAIKNAKVYLEKPQIYAMPMANGPMIPIDSIYDSTTTDAQGNFSFKNVGKDSYTLSISATGYQPKNVPVSITTDTTVSISLLSVNALGTIMGTVYMATPPGVVGCGYSPVGCVVGTVEGCTVSVSFPPIVIFNKTAAQSLLPAQSGVFTAITNSQGAYAIDSVPITYANRSVTVSAIKDGFAQESKAAVLQPGQPVPVYFALQIPYVNKAQKTIDNVTYTTATDRASYNVGENINVRYTIKNNSSVTVFDSFACCSENLLATTTSGETAYRYGGIICPCPLGSQPVPIAPGDSMVSNFPAFTYTGTAPSLTITAKLGGSLGYGYSTPAVSVLVGINQATIPVVRQDVEKASGKNAPLVTYMRSSKTLAITSDRPQLVLILAYTLNGRKIAELSGNRFLNVGTQTIDVKNAARYNGIMVFRIQGEGFVETAPINLIN